VLGIIGKNGAGKSTLLKILSRITSPTTGHIKAKGRIASLLEVGTGFHPEMTGRENVYLNGTILGMTKREIDKKFEEIMDFAGCLKYADTPVKRYSSGMMVRLGFAVAAFLEPEILIVDEVLAVGDAEFQKKAIGKMQDISSGGGRTVLFVSHNMGSIKNICHRALLLEYGNCDSIGDVTNIVDNYLSKRTDEATGILDSLNNRSGSRKVLFHKIHYENIKNNEIKSVLSGEDFYIVFTIKVNEPVKNVNIGYSLHNYLGDTISVLYSGYQNHLFNFNSAGKYLIKCQINNFNLSNGRYLLKGRIEVDNEESDWPKDILSYLDVEKGDFYNTGTVGFKGNSLLLIKGKWI
jgi:lipopolysaccharide transport system ATP-binding protein